MKFDPSVWTKIGFVQVGETELEDEKILQFENVPTDIVLSFLISGQDELTEVWCMRSNTTDLIQVPMGLIESIVAELRD